MKTLDIIELFNSSKTEEDVKRAVIELFNIPSKDYSLSSVDLCVGDKIWFEAKHNEVPIAHMLAQLLWYVKDFQNKGKTVPSWLGVVDKSKIGFIETSYCLNLLERTDLKDLKSPASAVVKNAPAFVDQIKADLLSYVKVFNISNEAEHVQQYFKGLLLGKPPKVVINSHNVRRVFLEWEAAIGSEISETKKAGGIPFSEMITIFLADATVEVDFKVGATTDVIPPKTSRDRTIFLVGDNTYKSQAARPYISFWNKYSRIENKNEYDSIVSNKHLLMDDVTRTRTGSFFTPLKIVSKAYETLEHTLGTDWMKDYWVWDCCAGTGNLLFPHVDPSRVFMSTLDQEDVRSIQDMSLFAGATIFQYDYLNDDIADGCFDYSMSKKLPEKLKEIISTGQKLLILINPPYGEAGSTLGKAGKTDIANHAVGKHLMNDWGAATSELFTQFIVRVYKETPSAKLAIFSKLKYVNGPNFDQFRNKFLADYQGGFVVEANVFQGVKGKFPIGFLVWDLAVKTPMSEIKVDVLNKAGNIIDEKTFYNLDTKKYLNKWVNRPKTNSKIKVVPLKNAVKVADGTEPALWSDGAIGYMMVTSNDFQNAGQCTGLFSSRSSKGGFYVTPDNLAQTAVVFTVRRIISHTWLNDRDQFLAPTIPLTPEFETDCLIWMPFQGMNLTASANLIYDNKEWEVVNHFIPFTEREMGLDASRTLEESRFMIDYMKDLKLSPEAIKLKEQGLILFQRYHELKASGEIPRSLRAAYKIKEGCSEGFYQIRNILERIEGKGFDKDLKDARRCLADKITPQVYEFGFLKI